MKDKNIIHSLLVLLSVAVFLHGCGNGGGGAASSSEAVAKVSGIAATGSAIQGRVYLKDSSGAVEQVADTDATGGFSFNVADVKAPFLLKAVWHSATGSHELYSFSEGAGRANVNPLTNAAVVAAAGVTDSSALDQEQTGEQMQSITNTLPEVIASLRGKLAPLLVKFNADINPITGFFKADHTGFDAMLDAVTIEATGGQIVVSNAATSKQIFVCSTDNIQGGQMNMDSLPAGTPPPPPTPLPGQAIYDNYCSSCHRFGTYDVSGSAPNLFGRSALVSAKLSGSHMGISLTATEIKDLVNFISQK